MRPIIVLDSHIPGAAEIFSHIGQVEAVPGHEIDAGTVKKADILIVRSITRVNEALLGRSSVRFVGTATAGIDHLDTDFLSASGIEWANAPGANAESVVEYALAAISVIASRERVQLVGRTLGVVGCGQVGERLAQRAESIGLRVLRNDPPRAAEEGGSAFTDLSTLLAESDIVSVHVPLERAGEYPTHHLLSAHAIDTMKKGAWLIQSSRGDTVDERAAVAARRVDHLGALVLDVFEGEPRPDPESASVADLATGHIAGYSRDAKRNGVLMIRNAALRYLGSKPASSGDDAPPKGMLKRPTNTAGNFIPVDDPRWLDGVIRQVMDVRDDDARFRTVLGDTDPAAAFHAYRAEYPPRYSWSRYNAGWDASEAERSLLKALGFRAAAQ